MTMYGAAWDKIGLSWSVGGSAVESSSVLYREDYSVWDGCQPK